MKGQIIKGIIHRKAKRWVTLEFSKESLIVTMFIIPWEFINNNKIYLDKNQTDWEASPQAKHAISTDA